MKTLRRDDHVFSIMYDTKCENGHNFVWVGDPPANGKNPRRDALPVWENEGTIFSLQAVQNRVLTPCSGFKKD